MYYIYTDHLNTPRAITDTANNLQWTWDNKEAFGNNLPTEVVTGFKFNFRFPGQYFDMETNLNYNIHREYNPVWGRYMSSDPLGLAVGINTYGYVSGNSLRSSDKLGLWGTKAHNELLESMFPSLNDALMQALKDGSKYTDSSVFQDPQYTYMHAMRNPNYLSEQIKPLTCNYMLEKRNFYIYYSQRQEFKRAFFELGMGLHAVMDSTSPAHEGFQYWGGMADSVLHKYGFAHGDFWWSDENKNKLTNQLKNKTITKMNDYFLSGNCDCLNN